MFRQRWTLYTAFASIFGLALLVHYDAEAGRAVASAVGGISIDASGVVHNPSNDMRNARLKALREAIAKPSDDLITPVEMRKVSLRGLEAAIAKALAQASRCRMRFSSWLACSEFSSTLR